ncbi:conserved hypothetical protein [Planktothrix serta PCC 8927]|uniref:LemA family protein n=1 Tax=Planktothrix serta PCC 8927 TaxID=671068 RepID=A0A7Z9BRS2_9CYAN|nr:LemA family protein [Planktothrix serta]VXD21148.1 conserved hypothetical protein [Planktothrix serta PCC 8927]
MNNPENSKIPEEIASEVLEVASRMYSEANNSYSLETLQQAGKEVSIPPEFIEKAIQEVREKHQIEEQKGLESKKQQKVFTRIAIAVAGFLIFWSILIYNSIASHKQNVNASWAQVENQMQRRADLIPNLVAVTNAQAKQEKEIIQLLIQSRESYLQANSIPEKIAASTQISTVIQQLNQYATTNPQLQSSQTFSNLQYELAGTENRIATERQRYNQAVQRYNQSLQTFPNILISSLFNFQEQPYFQAEDKTVPKVNIQ